MSGMSGEFREGFKWIKQVFIYGFGILLFLSGVGGLIDGGWGILGGLILILTALFLMPVSRPVIIRTVDSVNGPDLSTLGRGTFIIVILAGLITGAVLLPPAESPSAGNTDAPTSSPNSTDTPTSPSEPSSENTSDSTAEPSSTDSSDSASQPTSSDTAPAASDSSSDETSDATSESSSEDASESPTQPTPTDTSDSASESQSEDTSTSTADTSESTSESSTTDAPDSTSSSASDSASPSTSDSSADGTSDSSTRSTDSSQTSSWTVTVISVTDGDTMDVRMPDGSTETIRLLGVDTPETRTGNTNPAEWEGIPDNADGREWLADWGGQASDYANERLAGQEIYIEVDSESDRRGTYDRLLVYAYQSESAEKSFNLRLIENGYARMYDTQFSERSEYQAAESEARNNDVGVWGYTEPTTSPPSSGGSGEGDSSDIVVSNIHADAPGNDHENLNEEYIELTNEGDSSVDITGWTLSDEANHVYHFPSGFTLEPGDSVTIYTGSGSDSDSELYWGSGTAVWNNTGDTIIVTNDDGETVVEHEYSG